MDEIGKKKNKFLKERKHIRQVHQEINQISKKRSVFKKSGGVY